MYGLVWGKHSQPKNPPCGERWTNRSADRLDPKDQIQRWRTCYQDLPGHLCCSEDRCSHGHRSDFPNTSALSLMPFKKGRQGGRPSHLEQTYVVPWSGTLPDLTRGGWQAPYPQQARKVPLFSPACLPLSDFQPQQTPSAHRCRGLGIVKHDGVLPWEMGESSLCLALYGSSHFEKFASSLGTFPPPELLLIFHLICSPLSSKWGVGRPCFLVTDEQVYGNGHTPEWKE